jgi:glycosyltransferase involved in cell wall biosynthesis
MKFLIITHVPHIIEQNRFFAYAPYVNEMNIWTKYVDELVILAPISNQLKTAIDSAYEKDQIDFIQVENFDILNFKNAFFSVGKLPKILWKMYKAMQKADHIHLRCPGNIGLLGCCMQIFFPKKRKTAKYAGNWDPNATKPWTYTLQQKILSNTFLTRNMQVLIYGEWHGQTKNCKSFFTASYLEQEKNPLKPVKVNPLTNFVFVGTLVKGKNPMYAVQLVEGLRDKGYAVALQLFGEGIERSNLARYVKDKGLGEVVMLQGNQDRETLKIAYQESDFVVLPSDSEGWPKAIAEGMFWGCVPIATNVSCVPNMLNTEERGLLLNRKLEEDMTKVASLLDNAKEYELKRNAAVAWSQKYTLDVFESEIKKLIM